MRRVAVLAGACLAACTFPEKHPGATDAADDQDAATDAADTDASIDATPIDSVIDASIDANLCLTCGADARCVDGACRCKWGYTGDGVTCTLDIDTIISTASDGRTTSLGNASMIHEAIYLRNAGGVVLSDGEIWFTEGTTSCGAGWDLRTVKFRPDVSGPTLVSEACEAEPDDPVTTSIAAHVTFQRVVCFGTHPPNPVLRCGSLVAPGSFMQTVDLGTMHDGVHVGAMSDGFAVATTNVDGAGSPLGVTLAWMTGVGEPVGTVATLGAAGESVLHMWPYGDRAAVFRASANGPVFADVVYDSGVTRDSVDMSALPGFTSRRFLTGTTNESPHRFVYAADGDLYVGTIDVLGLGGAKKFGTTTIFTGAVVVPMFGGYGIVHSSETEIYFLRVDGMGRVTEAQRTIAIDAKVQLIGAAFDGNALWVVYGTAPGVGSETWNVSVRRIA